MKTNYFTKVEDKYVFNVSLIFWHLFIALITLGIIIGICLLLWSIFPASEKTVKKQEYPAEKIYPAPVTVALSELIIEEKTMVDIPEPPKEEINNVKAAPVELEDTKGKAEYITSLDALKILIPPTKYSWAGSGYWSYPLGERYWNVYKQEKYRQWNITAPGLEDKLKESYKDANAKTYSDKKRMIDGYISVIKPMKEEARLYAIESLLIYISNDVARNLDIYNAITQVVVKMKNETSADYISKLAWFGRKNNNDGVPFIIYISSNIDKYAASARIGVINVMIEGYNYFFNQDIKNFTEATDLYLPFLKNIKPELQTNLLYQYYSIYVGKNRERDNQIAQIKNDHQLAIRSIDEQFASEKFQANMDYQVKKIKKTEYRNLSLKGVGIGIVLIVMIGTILAFLSIQRSVRKIEEKITQS